MAVHRPPGDATRAGECGDSRGDARDAAAAAAGRLRRRGGRPAYALEGRGGVFEEWPTSPTCRRVPGPVRARGAMFACRPPRRPALPAGVLPGDGRRRRDPRRGRATRQLNNFFVPGGGPAHRLVAVEVLTPGGNWSSYPPHKHDVAARRRGRAGGDLLLPVRRRGRVRRAPHLRRRRLRRDGGGHAATCSWCRRLPRPVRRAARFRHVLPQRARRPG